ncbi:MAG: RusA family crossover junction endodeoxyribonuclease [Bacilli bacterium]|nr:RusA family crossover junction endodeoxyribonuclease [Bacilli bacterium]
MKLFILLDPPTVTAQEKKIVVVRGKPHIYEPENVKEAKEQLKKHLRPLVPKSPLMGPLKLTVSWLFPKGTKHKHMEYRSTKPDTDNLEKLLKDCMTQLHFWEDDAQVAIEHVEKVWSDEPTGISIEIIELPKFRKEEHNL